MSRHLIIALLLVFVQLPMLNAEPFNRIGQGVRNLGMGNVGIALSHDENALHYNPAGLAGVDEFYANFALLGEVSDDAIDLISELQNAESSSIGTLLGITLGKRLHLRFLGSTNVVIPLGLFTLGASILGEGQVNLRFQNPTLPQINFSYQIDQVQTVGGAIPIGKGGFVIGLGVRIVDRLGLSPTSISVDALLTSANDSSNSLLSQYKGADTQARAQGYDLGFQWRLEGESRLTLGFVAQNVGGLNFAKEFKEYEPKDIPAEYSAGISIQPGNDIVRFLLALDIRDLSQQGTPDSDFTKRLHTGFELGLFPIDSGASFIALRSGYNQGYFTYGFELNPFFFARLITIQAAVYSEETGENSGQGKEARKVIQLSFAF